MANDTTALRHTCVHTPLGLVRLCGSQRGLAGVWFEGQSHQPNPQQWQRDDQHPVLQSAAQQLLAYLAGKRTGFDLPLQWVFGTPFQQAVWSALCAIPFGCTVTYGSLASSLGRPRAVRAVGAAVGRNPLSIVAPCHRVLGRHGQLTGYAGGLERKAQLLALEGSL